MIEKDVLAIYNKIKPSVKTRIKEFKDIWNKGTDKDIFTELAFCILTPQSKAKSAWKAIEALKKNNALYNGKPNEIKKELNIVRFKNKKAEFIVMARELFFDGKQYNTKSIIEATGNTLNKRKWLVKNIKGMGYKEASHFLRNVGFAEDVAILDRHILKNLQLLGTIKEIPTSISDKKYLEIEEKMKKLSLQINIPMEYLDFVLWYKEAGEVFK